MLAPNSARFPASEQCDAKRSITKTHLFKYIENFTTKDWKISDKDADIFFIFLLKT